MKAITTKYIGATNTKPARIAATDGDKNRVVIAYPHECDAQEAHQNAASVFIKEMGWHLEEGFWGFVTGWQDAARYVHICINRDDALGFVINSLAAEASDSPDDKETH